MGFGKWLAKRGALGGMIRVLYKAYMQARRENPTLTDEEIAPLLIEWRFDTVSLRKDEKTRYELWMQGDVLPKTLEGICLEIAYIEMESSGVFVQEIIDEELARLGYISPDF